MVDLKQALGPFASLRTRLAAFAVDYAIIAVYLGLLTLIALTVPSVTRVFQSSPGASQAAGFLVLTLPVMLYFGFWEGSAYGATPGKRAAGIVVRHSNGEPVTFVRSLTRNALKLVPWELAHTCLWRIPGWPQPTGELPAWAVGGFLIVWTLVLLNVVLAWKTRTGQTAYDWIVDSVVVRTVRTASP